MHDTEAAIRHVVRSPVRLVSSTTPDPLSERAKRLWPDSRVLQAKWLRAVRLVRNTKRGWLLDEQKRRIGA